MIYEEMFAGKSICDNDGHIPHSHLLPTVWLEITFLTANRHV